MSVYFNRLWYGPPQLLIWVLRPLSWGFRLIVAVRRWILHAFQIKFPVPVIVVGNLTVGGVGKTPLVIELAKKIQEKGLRVGIVSRGYKAQRKQFPYEVQVGDTANSVGDEPLLLALKTGCPVVIDPKRVRAVRYLLKKHKPQIIISDDGLQHHRMGRAVELLLIDGLRGLGNGLCLPAGPLREPCSRLKKVDFLIVNGGVWDNAFSMTIKPGKIVQLSTKKTFAPEVFKEEMIAIAAIGHPERFYSTLSQLGIEYRAYAYPDHYQLTVNDLNYPNALIIMTEKDAVKCCSLNSDKLYYLPIVAVLNDEFWTAFWSHKQLQGLLI